MLKSLCKFSFRKFTINSLFAFGELHNFARLPPPNAQLYGYINNIDNMSHCIDYKHYRSGIGGQAL